METGSALVSSFADIVADPGLLLAWRAPLAALLAASSPSSSAEGAAGTRSLPHLPPELTAHAAFERHLALTLLVFALISAVMTVMLLRAQRPEAAKRDELRARKALMFAKGAAREKLQKELAESIRTYDPFRFRHAIAVLIGAAIAQALFGVMHLVSLRALFSAPLAAADAGPDALQRFFIGEEPRMDALVWRHRVYVALHNIGFLLGILLVILRLRIPRVFVFAGMTIACECGAMYMLENAYTSRASLYLEWLQTAALPLTSPSA